MNSVRQLTHTTGFVGLIAVFLVAGVFRPAQAQIPTAVGWTPLPASTSLQGSGACPPNNFDGDPFLFAEQCQNVIRTWNGAIADTNANRLIIWGGGHTNYYGNEIYSLNLAENPITLTRVKDPTVPTNFNNSQNCVESIPPGSTGFAPNSREDYGGLAFIPTADVMYILNGSKACLLGNGSTATWTISLNNISSSTSWVFMNPTMTGPQPGVFAGLGGGSYGNLAVYDPNSGLVFVSDQSALFTYNYQANTTTRVTAIEGFVTGIYLSAAIDPVRKLFVAVGGCGGGTCNPGNGVFVADISNPASTSLQNWTSATITDPNCLQFLSGGANPITAANPGIVYDPVANDFVGWPNQGNSVYIMTPDTVNKRLTCQVMTFPNGPPNSAHHGGAPNTSYGTFGRFQYFPAFDAFVLVNDWNIPPYILRLRSGSGYTVTATPSTASVNPGSSASYTVNVNAQGSFAGTVGLSVSGLPSGATASFNPASIVTSGSSTLTVNVPAGSSASNSTLTITGTNGSATETATVTLDVTVPTFTLSATPSVASASPGNSASYTVNVSAANGFTGTVNLGVSGLPSGATASFNPTSITTSGTSTLTVSIPAGSSASNSSLTISGTSGSIKQTANVTLNVTVPDFMLTATPGSETVSPGGSTTYTVNTSALNGLTGTINLSVSGQPSGATVSFSSNSVNVGGSSTLTVSTTSGTPTGNFTLTIVGKSGSLTHTVTVTLNVTDFAISATPVTQSVTPGGGTTYTVNIGALNGFSGSVGLSVSGLPTGATGTFNPASVTGTGSSTLAVQTSSGTLAGSNTLTITGSSGTLSHATSTTLVVNPANTPPVITSAGTASGVVGSAFSYQITASNTPTSYGATALPAGLTLNSGTGLISGTPTSAGTSTVTLSASNGGGTGTATLQLTITAAVAFVQEATNLGSTTGSLPVSFARSTGVGDLVLVAFDFDTNATAVSVSDTQGNTYTQIGNQLTSPGGSRSVLYYAKNIKGGADTVTVTLSANSAWLEVYLTEYSEADTTNPIDAQAAASGPAGTVSSGNAPTSAAGDLIFGYCLGDWVCSAGSGFAVRSTFDSNLIEDELAGNAGSYAATGTANNGWSMQMVAIKHR